MRRGLIGCGFALVVSAVLFGCGSENKDTEVAPQPSASSATTVIVTPPSSASQVASTPPPPQLPPVDFVEGTPDTPPAKAPTLAILAPTKDQLIAPDKAGDFEVKLDLKGWDVPGDAHNHVHLILDGKPYQRIDDPKAPIKLSTLDPAIGEGQHVLVAFPSRGTHESVKPIGKASPLAIVSFYVGKKKGEATWKPTDPTLIYSRPKGENKGAPPPAGILVDWYLANAELGDGKFTINATVTGPGLESGKQVTIKDWKPWRITNIRDGKYTVHMVLMDKAGKPVPGAMNDVTRDFTVDTKSTEAPHH